MVGAQLSTAQCAHSKPDILDSDVGTPHFADKHMQTPPPLDWQDLPVASHVCAVKLNDRKARKIWLAIVLH